MAGGTAKTRFCQAPTAWYGLSMHATSNAGIGTGKCIEFQNQKRFSSFSRLASAKNAWYGYISSQPLQPGGVSMEYGLGNAPTDVDAVNACPSSRSRVRLARSRNPDPPPVYMKPWAGGG